MRLSVVLSGYNIAKLTGSFKSQVQRNPGAQIIQVYNLCLNRIFIVAWRVLL